MAAPRPATRPATYAPGPTADTVRAPDGTVHLIPEGWGLVPPGDSALTRRLKAEGPHWVVAEVRRRRLFALGVYAPTATAERLRAELAAERATEGHARKQEAAARRREQAQAAYVGDFHQAILAFLRFDPTHSEVAERLATVVANHATPVGSGTVARTERIPIEQRAEAAVIAWMRHQTTAYDSLSIARIKGERRAVRRGLAQGSHALLERYRRGDAVATDCPLLRALSAVSGEIPTQSFGSQAE